MNYVPCIFYLLPCGVYKLKTSFQFPAQKRAHFSCRVPRRRMSVFKTRQEEKNSGKFSLSYQEICNSLTKRQIVKCKNTLRANNDQIFIALFSQNELLFQICLTIENTASPVSRDFLTLCSSLGKRCIDNRQCALCRIGRTDDTGFRKMAV